MMVTFRRLQNLLGVLLALLGAVAATAKVPVPVGVPVGVGKFTFTNPLTADPVDVYYVRDKDYDPADPPVFVYHGVRRNADDYRDGWIELAREHGLFVIVPEFRAETYPGVDGYNLGNLFVSEADLTRKPEKGWSYHLPRTVFTYLREHLEATTADGYMAFGHSAGSQFLHRQMAFAPDPFLLLGVAANAGWYTFPDPAVAWPYGLKGTGFEGASMKAFFASPLVILLGEEDTDPQHRYLRRTPEAMDQGLHRLARGHRFFESSAARARDAGLKFAWRLETVPKVNHNGSRMAPPAARLMIEAMASRRAAQSTHD